MAMIPKSTRERWRAQLANAAPRPWHHLAVRHMQHEVFTGDDERVEGNATISCWHFADAALIASAPEAMSQLLDEVERLEAERDEWKRRAIAHGCDAEKGDPDCG